MLYLIVFLIVCFIVHFMNLRKSNVDEYFEK